MRLHCLGYYPKRNLKSFPIARAKRLRRGSADRAYMVNKVGKPVCKPDGVWYTDYKKNLMGAKHGKKLRHFDEKRRDLLPYRMIRCQR